jgi:hypothetical protein
MNWNQRELEQWAGVTQQQKGEDNDAVEYHPECL